MNTIGKIVILVMVLLVTIIYSPLSPSALAEQKKEKQLTLPKNIRSIAKSNTFPNLEEQLTIVEPSKLTEQLLEQISEPIENPELIALLNESTVKTTPFSIGYDAQIYVGRWPLYYISENSSVIWDYKHINTNELNNKHYKDGKELTYTQAKNEIVKGALMNQIDEPDMIKKLISHNINDKAPFSVSFSTEINEKTKLNDIYKVGANKVGILDAYVPAVKEKGQVVYGDVYIKSKGANIHLDITNVTKHSIGAWIPIEDHVALTYTMK